MGESVEVEFKGIGNQRYLTDQQLAADPRIMAFFKSFRDCFEHAPWPMDAWIFTLPESAPDSEDQQ